MLWHTLAGNLRCCNLVQQGAKHGLQAHLEPQGPGPTQRRPRQQNQQSAAWPAAALMLPAAMWLKSSATVLEAQCNCLQSGITVCSLRTQQKQPIQPTTCIGVMHLQSHLMVARGKIGNQCLKRSSVLDKGSCSEGHIAGGHLSLSLGRGKRS